MDKYFSLLLRIQNLGLTNSQDFPSFLSKELVEKLDLIACSFYTINIDEDRLILRGQKGFKYEDYMSFSLHLNTYAGRTYSGKKIVIDSDLLNSEEYRDKNLITKYKLHDIISIPLVSVNNKTEKSNCYGAICLYPKKGFDDSFLELMESFQCSICLAYSHSVERTKVHIREKVVTEISKSPDLNSALYRILKSLKDEMSIEGGSVYLYEEKLRLLRLRATTGIKNKGDLNKEDIMFSRRDHSFVTWNSLLTKSPIVKSGNKDIIEVDKYTETTRSSLASLLVIPIIKIGKTPLESKTVGVFRAVNKLLVHDNKYELISFAKEDLVILQYVCEIIALSSHMFLSKSNKVSYFEKIMHGTKSNIQASIQNLDLLEKRGKINAVLPHDLHYTIHDTKEWLYDIKNQMDRLENSFGEEVKITKIYLAGDVLINSVRLFEKSAETRDIANSSITNLKDEEFFELPCVMGNIRTFMTVFRNLIENSLKYRNHEKNECIVELSYSTDKDFLYIEFKDYGIGIPKEDEKDVFDDGFRSENAIRQDPAGTGLGLTHSKQEMRQIGGDLYLISNKPTTLVVKIKKA